MNFNLGILFCGAFFLGSVPTAYIAGKIFLGIDIRKFGSGNVGATNAFRVMGKRIGIAVFILDFLKGAAPVYLYYLLNSEQSRQPYLGLLAGLFSVLGHVFSPFMGFKGGKGVATGSGVLMASQPVLFFLSFAVWWFVFFVSRMVSLSSLFSVLFLALGSLIMVQDRVTQILFMIMAVFVFWTHRSNIGRIVKGQEPKFVSRQNT